MSKKNTKQKNKKVNNQKHRQKKMTPNVSSGELDKESVITKAIVNAHECIAQREKEEEETLNKNLQKEWLEILGQKEEIKNDNWFMSKINVIINDVRVMWNIIFFKAENAKEMRVTLGLMSLAVYGIFALCKWCLYILCLIGLAFILIKGIEGVVFLPIALLAWFIARMFRIAIFEVQKMKDGNILIAIFSGSVSLISLIISIITLVMSINIA